MKNFFTGVRLPKGGKGELGQCVAALAELISQLRITLNSIDLENMTPELKRKLGGVPEMHFVKSTDELPLNNFSQGDLVIVYEEASGLSRVREMYIYTGEGIV